MLSEPTSLPIPLSPFLETETPALIYLDSSPEQTHHTKIFENLRMVEDRICIIERQVELMKEDLAVLKEEHRLLKEHILSLPNLIGSHIQDALKNL